MIIGIPRETFPNERRVSLVPLHVPALKKNGLDVIVEKGAGLSAGFDDDMYVRKGASVVEERKSVFQQSDIILQVKTFSANPEKYKSDISLFKHGLTIIGFSNPLANTELFGNIDSKKINLFAVELIPRITRAQSMDALSSMATISGYKSVIIAAQNLNRMFPMLMTAAGTITPAKVLVIGVGVAGLQAIATARRLGAVVEAYDIRPAVKEQVQSLGAKFVELEIESADSEDSGGYAKVQTAEFYNRQQELLKKVISECNVVITTASVPGKKAPVLIKSEMLSGMAAGSVIVDLAAEQGGNCYITRYGEKTMYKDVIVIGPENVPSSIPFHASQMYSKNMTNLLMHLVKDNNIDLDSDDEILKSTLVLKNGDVVHEQVSEIVKQKQLMHKKPEE